MITLGAVREVPAREEGDHLFGSPTRTSRTGHNSGVDEVGHSVSSRTLGKARHACPAACTSACTPGSAWVGSPCMTLAFRCTVAEVAGPLVWRGAVGGEGSTTIGANRVPFPVRPRQPIALQGNRFRVEPPQGFEPWTYALRVRCSTPELGRPATRAANGEEARQAYKAPRRAHAPPRMAGRDGRHRPRLAPDPARVIV